MRTGGAGRLAPRAPRTCTYWVHVPASGVGYRGTPGLAAPGPAGTFRSRYVLRRTREKAGGARGVVTSHVVVQGLPAARLVRRADWGWCLCNSELVARSVAHQVQPVHYADTP